MKEKTPKVGVRGGKKREEKRRVKEKIETYMVGSQLLQDNLPHPALHSVSLSFSTFNPTVIQIFIVQEIPCSL